MISTNLIYHFWYQKTVARDNKEVSAMVRTSLKNYYKTSVIKRVCADCGMSEKTARSFFYKKSQLKAFDMLMLMFRYDFIRESVGLVRLDTEFYGCGNKLGEKNAENVLLILKNNPSLTFNDLSRYLGITPRSVEYEINKLKKMKLLRRTGGRKNGKWVVP